MKFSAGLNTVVITVSDSGYRGERKDKSGPAVAAEAKRLNMPVIDQALVSDDPEIIKQKLIEFSDRPDVNVILTTGGTGLSPRDNTPEATRAVLEKEIPGLIELMRWASFKTTPRAALTRAVAGVRSQTLIINLPGSVKGAGECLQAIADLIPHAVELICGEKVRCGG
ncbi:MAG: MogA/MoaB family molybdenum cofactor biosynthesis protein [Acidobacteria bacterium]|nr:MogA/MoaB family molybdenum cofactor biosynthesis protein [Acidobacteriota bacterium]MBI3656449.1 MogA/MoaB family molybdenum cofactor biosynthesis protein [Acidobacteriota bacterium]